MATLQHELPSSTFHTEQNPFAWPEEVMPPALDATPSLPAILLHAALGLGSAGLMLVITRWGLGYDWLISSVVAAWTFVVLFGPLGILCSRLTGSPTLLRNLGYGCGLMVVTLLFFGLCGLVGGLAAVVAQAVGLPFAK
ncbi:MAG: hypothetical protein U0350_43440 [Caldilineaceae bacterium]